jgi:AAHS family benzoate transporter-like MFS transporter
MTANDDSTSRGTTASRARNAFIISATIVAISDGFDGGIFGVSLPKMLEQGVLGINVGNSGTVASAQLFGMLIGAVLAGILADRIGKRRVIVGTILFYTVFTTLQAFAPGYTAFLIFRVLAGIGIGGVTPALIAHVSELSKPSRRFLNNTIMLVGTAVGAFLTPLVGLVVLNAFDFRVMFVIGGVVALLTVPITLIWIPESIAFLRARGRAAEAQAIADRFGLEGSPVATQERVRLRALFARGLRLRTIVIMLAALFVFSISTAFQSWFPQYLVAGGVEFNSALVVAALMTAGMITGCLVGGRLQDVGNPRLVVGIFLVAGFVLLSATGLSLGAPLPVILVLVFFFGATTGALFLFNGMVANAYPPHLRGSILALDFGAGRVAAVVAAALGGTLLAAALPPAANFVIWAIVPLLGGVLVLIIPAYGRHADPTEEKTPAAQAVTPAR